MNKNLGKRSKGGISLGHNPKAELLHLIYNKDKINLQSKNDCDTITHEYIASKI